MELRGRGIGKLVFGLETAIREMRRQLSASLKFLRCPVICVGRLQLVITEKLQAHGEADNKPHPLQLHLCSSPFQPGCHWCHELCFFHCFSGRRAAGKPEISSLSVLWLLPQFALIAAAEAFVYPASCHWGAGKRGRKLSDRGLLKDLFLALL